MKKGDKVKYVGCSEDQYRWGSGGDPRTILNIGEEYIIEKIEVHSWHTLIRIKGIDGKYNSVCFRKAGDGK